jgi:hypothetical protein
MRALIGRENCDGSPDSAKFPVNFPVKFGAETGSYLTASSTAQSDANRRFPVSDE